MAQPPAAMNTAARDLLIDLQTQNGFNTTEIKLINDIVSKVLNPQSLPAPEAAATAPISQHDAEQSSTAAGQLPGSNSQLDIAKMSAGLAKLSQLRASQNLPKLQDALAAGARSQPQQRPVPQIKVRCRLAAGWCVVVCPPQQCMQHQGSFLQQQAC
jgi:hypothetical protein